MGRPKTISDDEVLRIARDIFREHGHTATTRRGRERRRDLGGGPLSALRHQGRPLLRRDARRGGPTSRSCSDPHDPPDDAREYLRTVLRRLGEYFAEVIPLALRVMMHPSFDPASLSRTMPGGPDELREGLARRIASLARRKRLAAPDEAVVARLLLSLAHDWALGVSFAHGTVAAGDRRLEEFVGVLWEGLRHRDA